MEEHPIDTEIATTIFKIKMNKMKLMGTQDFTYFSTVMQDQANRDMALRFKRSLSNNRRDNAAAFTARNKKLDKEIAATIAKIKVLKEKQRALSQSSQSKLISNYSINQGTKSKTKRKVYQKKRKCVSESATSMEELNLDVNLDTKNKTANKKKKKSASATSAEVPNLTNSLDTEIKTLTKVNKRKKKSASATTVDELNCCGILQTKNKTSQKVSRRKDKCVPAPSTDKPMFSVNNDSQNIMLTSIKKRKTTYKRKKKSALATTVDELSCCDILETMNKTSKKVSRIKEKCVPAPSTDDKMFSVHSDSQNEKLTSIKKRKTTYKRKEKCVLTTPTDYSSTPAKRKKANTLNSSSG